MTLRSLVPVTGLLLLTACTTTNLQLADSQWQLVRVDQQSLAADSRADLHFDSTLQVSGNAGCNRFFGSASLDGNQLVADQLGVTKMACFDKATQQLEATVLATLSQHPQVTQDAGVLTLRSDQHTLEYQQQPRKK